MSGPMGLLLGLLLLAYLGSLRAGGGKGSRWGSPTGAQYLVLGLLLGPLVAGVIEREWLADFRPIFVAGASWLALIAGVGYGRSATERRLRLAVLGVALTGFIGLGVLLAVLATLSVVSGKLDANTWLLAVGAAAVGSATTHYGLRWVVVRYNASGPLSAALVDTTRFSPLVPAVLLALVCAWEPGNGLPGVPVPVRLLLTLALGGVLGGLSALLLGREFRKDESWGILLGTALLGSGVCVRLGLSAVAALFVCGLTITALSVHRAEIRSMLVPTDRGLLLPVALLAGASLGALPLSVVLSLVLPALAARLLFEIVRGAVLVRAVGAGLGLGPWVGLGLTSTGGFTLAAALELNWRLPAELGAVLLWLAALGNILGELLGPQLLRRALGRAGELLPGPRAQAPTYGSASPGATQP